MSYRDEARTLRKRQEDDRDDFDRSRDVGIASSPTKLVWTVSNGSYPTGTNVTYAVRELRSTGQESEGYPISTVEIGPIFFAQILGANVALNTKLLVTLQEGRWMGGIG